LACRSTIGDPQPIVQLWSFSRTHSIPQGRLTEHQSKPKGTLCRGAVEYHGGTYTKRGTTENDRSHGELHRGGTLVGMPIRVKKLAFSCRNGNGLATHSFRKAGAFLFPLRGYSSYHSPFAIFPFPIYFMICMPPWQSNL